jgi:3-hydroxyisobutyrate dehydrogenase-like beta-hydroxyacid dehydrogenase
MGRAVGATFIENGVQVSGYDISDFCVEKSRAAGIEMCSSLAQLAETSDWIILFLPGPAEIAECVCSEGGLLSALPAGAVITDMCTSSPENSVAMEAAARAAAVRYIDAPVMGRPEMVGKWTLPVGGDLEALEEVRALLDLVAAHVVHVGAPGSGHKVKLLNQLMFGAINSMTAEMMAVAQKVGVPPSKLYEIMIASQAATVSNLFWELGRRVSEERYSDPTFTVSLLCKDVRLGVEMAEAAGAPLLLGRSVDFLNKASCAQGYGAEDTAVMWHCVENLWRTVEA